MAIVQALNAGFALPHSKAPIDLVVIGPRGGFKLVGTMTIEGAVKLRDQLNIVLDDLTSLETIKSQANRDQTVA